MSQEELRAVEVALTELIQTFRDQRRFELANFIMQWRNDYLVRHESVV